MSLQGYYNRFSASDKYDELLFRASKGLQSAELNESQSILSDRITKIANSLFQDGAIISGGAATVDPQTGAVNLLAGSLYVPIGSSRSPSRSFNIPTTGGLQLGVRLTTTTVTELESASLRDPARAPGTTKSQALAVPSASWLGAGLETVETGDFYGVYDVLNGALVTVEPPPVLDAAKKLVAQYDRDANGSYIVSGLSATSLNKDATNTNYVFTVAEGVANVWAPRSTSRRPPASAIRSTPICKRSTTNPRFRPALPAKP